MNIFSSIYVTVTLLCYYERFSVNRIFLSPPVTLLLYDKRFSVNSIFISRSVTLAICYVIVSAFLITLVDLLRYNGSYHHFHCIYYEV